MDNCVDCPNGFFQNELAQTACKECDALAGSTSENASLMCNLCIPGTYEAASGSCIQCNAGEMSSRGDSECSLCPTGKISRDSYTRCESCGAGKYGNNERTECLLCDEGTYSQTTGAANKTSCEPCVAGSFGTLHRRSCDLCVGGRYSEEFGSFNAASCLACPRGKFSQALGADGLDMCNPCPAGFRGTAEGQVSCKNEISSSVAFSNTGLIVGDLSAESKMELVEKGPILEIHDKKGPTYSVKGISKHRILTYFLSVNLHRIDRIGCNQGVSQTFSTE